MTSTAFLVLPFESASGDATREYIATAVTTGLTSGLSNVADSLVIAGPSARAIASQSLAIADIAQQFSVGFVLRGAVSLDGTRLQVSADLIRADDAEQLWSGRFEDEFVALGDLVRKVVAQIARRLNVPLVDAGANAPSAPQPRAEALDSLLRAQAIADRPATAQTISEAGHLYTAALADPAVGADAKAGLAAVHLAVALASHGNATAIELRQSERLLREALDADSRNGHALNTLGALRRTTGKPGEALAAYEAAVATNRNDAGAHAQIGRLVIDIGHARRALSHIQLALRISPLDPQRPLWLTFAGLALLHEDEPTEARAWLEKAVAAGPQLVTPRVFLAVAQQLGRQPEDARRTMAAARQMSPALSIGRVEQQFAPHDRAGLQWSRIRNGLHDAGLPN